MISLLLAPTVLLLPLGLLAQGDESAAELLRETSQRLRSLRTLHCVMQVEDGPSSAASLPLRTELWVDLESGRVRNEISDVDSPRPYMVVVSTERGTVVHQTQAGEFAQQPGGLELEGALASAFAGELWLSALGGKLNAFRKLSYGEPELSEERERVSGVDCRVVSFGGTRPTRLWIDKDQLPRRIEGFLPTKPPRRRMEEIVQLETGPQIESELFQLRPRPGQQVLASMQLARQRWGQLPPQRDSWPATGSKAPSYRGMDLDAKRRSSDELDSPHVLAFWFSDHDPVVEELARAQGALKSKDIELVSLHFGEDRIHVAKIAKRHKLDHEIWCAGAGEDSAFVRFAVFSCPVFVVVDGEGVVRGATRKAAELGGIVDGL